MNAIIYIRVLTSTKDEVQRQTETLRQIATDRGWTIASVVVDDAGLDARRYPGIEGIKRRIAARQDISVVMTPSLTCIGCSVDDLVNFMVAMETACVGVYAHAEGIDTDGADGGGFLRAMSVLATYRTSLRQERTKLGRHKAQQAGIKFGRRPVPDEILDTIRKSLAAGVGIRPTSRVTGVSPAKVHEIKCAMASSSDPGEALPA